MTRLRAAFELTALELDAAGTARAIRELLAALQKREDVEIVPLAHPRRARGGRILRGLDRELRWMPFALPRRAQSADLLHCPAALGPVRGAVPLVVTVNDVLALDHPEWFATANVAQQRLALGRLVRRARAVIVPSRATRDALVARTGVEHVHVVPYGVGAPFTPGPPDAALLARHGIRAPYGLTVATLQPRKNLAAALVAHEGLDGVQLVVAGGRGWHDQALAERLRGSRDVVVTGRVSDEELVGLLRGAAFLVHPSHDEGFGFPPLEAMACGTPVVCSTSGSLPEVVGEAAPLVAPDDPRALREAIEGVLADPAPWRARGLERAAELTWSRCAERTVAVYAAAVA